MPSLPNNLRLRRKEIALSQEEVGFLLGLNGVNKGSKVSRDENYLRIPTLEIALAYQAIYGKAICELFAGLYEQIEQSVSSRAKILSYRNRQPSKPSRTQALLEISIDH